VVPDGLTNVVAIAAGRDHCMALTSGGSVVAWVDYYYSPDEIFVPANLANVKAIAAGGFHSLAIVPSRRKAQRHGFD